MEKCTSCKSPYVINVGSTDGFPWGPHIIILHIYMIKFNVVGWNVLELMVCSAGSDGKLCGIDGQFCVRLDGELCEC